MNFEVFTILNNKGWISDLQTALTLRSMKGAKVTEVTLPAPSDSTGPPPTVLPENQSPGNDVKGGGSKKGINSTMSETELFVKRGMQSLAAGSLRGKPAGRAVMPFRFR